MYHLTFQFKSNERPWSGSHVAHGVETDEAAIKWARYFIDHIGCDYQITLYKAGTVLPLPELVECDDCGMDEAEPGALRCPSCQVYESSKS